MDKRSEARNLNNMRVFVHVYKCEENPGLVGTSIACETIDFSTRGIRFKSGQELFVNTLLNITISVREPFSMFLLRGEIRWVRMIDEGYYIGIRLCEAEGTDSGQWETEFSNIFSK